MSQYTRILDYSLLTTDEEYDFQRKVLALYVEKTDVFITFFAGMLSNLKKRLSVLGEGDNLAAGGIEGATKSHNLEKPIMEPLLRAHAAYGNSMIQILDLLQKNKDVWVFEDGELLIDDDIVLSKFNEIFEVLASNEATITELSNKLLGVM